MPAPHNPFKAALRTGKPQIGFWLGLGTPVTAEIAAGAGFDWLVVDGEHGPNDLPLLMAQLQAIAGVGSHAVVRSVAGETWMIKQLLDIGAQTILVPMVETAAQAEQLVRAMRYPPYGMRGVGAALARASAYNRIPDYLQTANDEACLIVQLESRAGLSQLEAIAAIEGVDGIFIGPADLAGDMGHLGRPGDPEVQAAVEDGLRRIIASGKAAGILTADPALARNYLEIGATFVAVGTDVTLFSNATTALARSFKGPAPKAEKPAAAY